MKNYKDEVFGRLTCIASFREGRKTFLQCVCTCGSTKIVRADHATSGRTQSCGCLAKEASSIRAKTHGKSKTKEFHSWNHMKQRCLNPDNPDWPSYGGRGISVHDAWVSSFDQFLFDVGACPSSDYSLDRIDVNQGYYPSNVRWATNSEQARNKRSSVRLSMAGIEKSLYDWAEETGIPASTIYARVHKLGWSAEKALTTSRLGNPLSPFNWGLG